MSARVGFRTGAVALVLSGIVAASSLAHTSKTPSQLLLSAFEDPEYTLANGMDAPDSFSGKLKSSKASCKRGRTVKLFREAGDNRVLVGEDKTSARGNWTVFAEDPGDGTYFAKVGRKKKGSGNHKHVCKPDQSPALEADDTVGPTDLDEDGFFTGSGGDCDDTDMHRHPGATEVDNFKDDDCDGIGDADLSDPDSDGSVGPADCDDTDAASKPGASEIADGKDNDCDGLADEDFYEAP